MSEPRGPALPSRLSICTALIFGLSWLPSCGETLPQRSLTRHPPGNGRSAGVTAVADRAPVAAERAVHWPAWRDGRLSVRLAEGPELPEVACDGAWSAADVHGAGRGGGSAFRAVPRLVGEELFLGAQSLGRPPVALRPVAGSSVAVGSRHHRGELRFELRSGALVVLGGIDLEDYLLGVVPSEMPDRFGLQALKAQAIAARSYAIAEATAGRTLHSDVRSQAYGGRTAETPLSTRAVIETRGLVLLAGSTVVKAFYHSTCGGRTEPAAALFPDATPGTLERVVDCPDCHDSPWRHWTRRFSASQVCAAVGLPAAPLQSVTVSPALVPGRPTSIHVSAGGRQATRPLPEFRLAIGASLPFSEALPSVFFARPFLVEPDALSVQGHGWGHGAGMCQYGAAGFARRGADALSILERYYPGCRVGPAP